MENTQNNQTELALEQMETFAMFMNAIDNASNTLNTLSGFLPYLDFSNSDMIQKYYESISYFAKGINSIKLGFFEYAASHQIELQDIQN